MRCAVLALVFAACGDDAVSVPPEANPLGTTNNILPFPSSLYERSDGGGVVLDVPIGAFPASGVTDLAFDPTPLARRRGWPASTTILWAATGGIDATTLPGPDAIATTVQSTSATVVLDMVTGELVPHFAEVDVNELDNYDLQAVYIRPMQRLAGGHRYAVGITRGVKRRDGSEPPITSGFAAVLADRNTGHARLDAARPRLREAVAALETAGVTRESLVVAWDFTVTPDDAAIADPLSARDAALAAMGPLGANLTYTVTSDLGTINNDLRIARRLEIDFQSPAVTGEAHAGYLRDASGNVIAQGTMTAQAYVMIPPCARFDNRAGILIYGHGFFGSLGELRQGEYARDLAAESCSIVAGTVWTGMSNDDIPNALLALNDLNKAWGFGERIFQGMVNTIALEQLLRGKLASELFVDGQGRSIVDPARVHFLGISLGHVLGATFFAYDPFITRAVLHVGAANWALMFERSSNWASYGLPLKSSYDTLLDAVIMEQVLQMALEGVDGATVANITVPGAAQGKQYLLQASREDTQVPNLASYFHARSLGLPVMSSSAEMPFALDVVTTTAPSALVIVDEKPSRKPPTTNETFSYSNEAHENARRRTLVQQQMREFWSTGVISNTCTGTCDCAAGNCGPLRMPMHGGS